MQFEWNARTQITMWFDNSSEEASLLRDYGTGVFFCLLLLSIVTKVELAGIGSFGTK